MANSVGKARAKALPQRVIFTSPGRLCSRFFFESAKEISRDHLDPLPSLPI